MAVAALAQAVGAAALRTVLVAAVGLPMTDHASALPARLTTIAVAPIAAVTDPESAPAFRVGATPLVENEWSVLCHRTRRWHWTTSHPPWQSETIFDKMAIRSGLPPGSRRSHGVTLPCSSALSAYDSFFLVALLRDLKILTICYSAGSPKATLS